MPAVLSAISLGARKGMLFKGGVHLEGLAKLKAIAFDKIGTLTRGEPEKTGIEVSNDLAREEFLQIAGSIENYSNHPLASAIAAYANKELNGGLHEPDEIKDYP